MCYYYWNIEINDNTSNSDDSHSKTQEGKSWNNQEFTMATAKLE